MILRKKQGGKRKKSENLLFGVSSDRLWDGRIHDHSSWVKDLHHTIWDFVIGLAFRSFPGVRTSFSGPISVSALACCPDSMYNMHLQKVKHSSFPVFLNCSRESREVPEFIVPTLIEKNTNFFGWPGKRQGRTKIATPRSKINFNPHSCPPEAHLSPFLSFLVKILVSSLTGPFPCVKFPT